jgi:hypothetical protein
MGFLLFREVLPDSDFGLFVCRVELMKLYGRPENELSSNHTHVFSAT